MRISFWIHYFKVSVSNMFGISSSQIWWFSIFCFSLFLVTRYVQIASVALAVLGLAKDYSRHHFHELSGKEKIPNFWISFKALLFYLAHIACRLPSLGVNFKLTIVLLALMFRQYFFIILLTFVLANIALSVCLLGRNVSKSIW